jgi:hypothetical protein
VYQYSNRSLSSPHDLGDIGDAEIGDDAQQYRISHVGWEPTDQMQRGSKVTVVVGRRHSRRGLGGLGPDPAILAANLVDVAVMRNGEQPLAKFDLPAYETR